MANVAHQAIPHAEPAPEVHEPAAPHALAEPTFLGLDPSMWVALAMLAVIAIMVWKKVPAAIAGALDKKIDAIREQLAEAEALRNEAEALRDEYAAKAKSAESEAAAIVERARQEADAIQAKAREDMEALVERRSRMAEEKIEAEERAAVDQLRAAAAEASRQAAARIIAERLDPAADGKLVDQTIASLARR